VLPGLIYLLLTLGSFCLWLIGFDPYSCPSLACSAVSHFFGRPLLLWGAAYYSLSAVFCFSGLIATKRKGALAVIYSGVTAHALLLLLAWRRTGELCPTCLRFLLVEALLAAYITVRPAGRSWKWPSAVAAASLVMISGILAFNPQVAPVAAMPEVPPAVVAESSFGQDDTASPSREIEVQEQQKYRYQVWTAIKTGAEKETPSFSQGLPSSVENSLPALKVTTPDGQGVTLDISRRPALFFSWWCSHCMDALQEVAKLPEDRRPYLVGTYLRGDDLPKFRAKLEEAGLKEATLYLASTPPEGIQAVPALVFVDGGRISHAEGVAAIVNRLKKKED